MRSFRCYCFLAAQYDAAGKTIHTDICKKKFADHEQMQKDECIEAGHADPEGGELCSACCEHRSLECGVCEDCGSDRSEDRAAYAYDMAKNARKYGE